MGSFVLEGFKYCYVEGDKKEILLDLEDWFSNKGRVPFHDYFDNITVSTLIRNNLEAHASFCGENTVLSQYDIAYAMLDTMLIREHTKSKYAKTILEYGASNEIIKKHFLSILSELQPESVYIQGDYEKKCDIAVINGVGECTELMQSVYKAYDSLKEGGLLLAMCIGQHVLNREIELAFSNGQEYLLAPDCIIWKVRK